jgi:hypothetical protein
MRTASGAGLALLLECGLDHGRALEETCHKVVESVPVISLTPKG